MNATTMLYRAAASPTLDGVEPTQGLCWLCGADLEGLGVPRTVLIRDTFMDHDKCTVPAATHVCCGCAWSFSEQIHMAGREKLQRLRNYSHFVIDGKWICLSKGQKREMQQILLDPPAHEWLGVIAVSGQKHIIFRAPTAYGRVACAIQVEEQRLTYTPPELRLIVADVEKLIALGFSKTEIDTGQYAQHRILKASVAAWQMADTRVRVHCGRPVFELALFLAQKEEIDE